MCVMAANHSLALLLLRVEDVNRNSDSKMYTMTECADKHEGVTWRFPLKMIWQEEFLTIVVWGGSPKRREAVVQCMTLKNGQDNYAKREHSFDTPPP